MTNAASAATVPGAVAAPVNPAAATSKPERASRAPPMRSASGSPASVRRPSPSRRPRASRREPGPGDVDVGEVDRAPVVERALGQQRAERDGAEHEQRAGRAHERHCPSPTRPSPPCRPSPPRPSPPARRPPRLSALFVGQEDTDRGGEGHADERARGEQVRDQRDAGLGDQSTRERAGQRAERERGVQRGGDAPRVGASTVTPWAFIATSRIPLAAPSASIATISVTSPPASAGRTSATTYAAAPTAPNRREPARAIQAPAGNTAADQPDRRAEQRQPELSVGSARAVPAPQAGARTARRTGRRCRRTRPRPPPDASVELV